MASLLVAGLLLLPIPAEALRSATRKKSGEPRTLRDFEAARIEEVRNDPRGERLRNPLQHAEQKRDDASVAACSISEEERCPLRAMTGMTKVFPGGVTKCLNGDPYYFEVFPGAADKLVIHLEGGGACWSKISWEMHLCTREIYPGLDGGVFGFHTSSCPQERGEVRNPLIGYTAVHIRYCSGDLHQGDSVTDWKMTGSATNKTVKVEQRGLANTLGALSWVKNNMAGSLESLVASGSSAGGEALWFWGPVLARIMSYKHAAFIGDSHICCEKGLATEAMWRICDSPTLASSELLRGKVPLCEMKRKPTTRVELNDQAIGAWPQVPFLALNSKFDVVQRFFADASSLAKQLAALRAHCGGEDSCDVSGAPRELTARRSPITPEEYYRNVNAIVRHYSLHPNFSWYLVAGEWHILAPHIFGDCTRLGYPDIMPDFAGVERRVHAQSWVSSSVLSSTPQGICEDVPYWPPETACSREFGSMIVNP